MRVKLHLPDIPKVVVVLFQRCSQLNSLKTFHSAVKISGTYDAVNWFDRIGSYFSTMMGLNTNFNFVKRFWMTEIRVSGKILHVSFCKMYDEIIKVARFDKKLVRLCFQRFSKIFEFLNNWFGLILFLIWPKTFLYIKIYYHILTQWRKWMNVFKKYVPIMKIEKAIQFKPMSEFVVCLILISLTCVSLRNTTFLN